MSALSLSQISLLSCNKKNRTFMYYVTDIDLEEVVASTDDGIYFM